MSMDKIIREDARLVILRVLSEQTDRRLNSSLIQTTLENYGITRTRDWVHDEMRRLEEMAAITVVEVGSVRVACLTQKGADHVERRLVIEGVKRPSAIGA